MALLDDIATDLPTFFDSATGFAKSASYTPHGGSAVVIKVIFSEPHESSEPESIAFANTGPIAIARTIDVPNAQRDDSLIVDSVNFFITEALPDGTGVTTLKLSRDLTTYPAPTNLATSYVGPGLDVPLTWAVNGLGQSNVEVWRFTGGQTTIENATKVATLSAIAASYTDTVPFDANWTYRVRTVGANGASAWSNTLNVHVDN